MSGGRRKPVRYAWAIMIIGLAVLLVGAAALAEVRADLSRSNRAESDTNAVGTPQMFPLPKSETASRSDERPAQDAQPVAPTENLAPSPNALSPSPPMPPMDREAGSPAASLEEIVQSLADESDAVFGIVIQELPSGRRLEWDAERVYYTASLYKLMVMYEVYKQHKDGTLSLDETIVISERALMYDLGTLQYSVGSEITIRQALEGMITYSDNALAVLLTDRVGIDAINGDMAALGLSSSHMLANDDLTTTAHDMGKLLELIAMGQAVDEAASAEMLDLLLRQGVSDRLPYLLPDSVPVAHKTGNWEGATHDVGIVFGPHVTYVIAVLSDGTEEPGPIARFSRRVYDYFEAP